MNVTFIQLPSFASQWKALGMTDEDAQAVEEMLMKRPEMGPVVAGTAGLRKVRWGSRAAIRIGYTYFRVADTIYLVPVFAKSDKGNFTKANREYIAKINRALESYHKPE